ncbi:MAG: ISAzo13 family transposase [Bryobacterales bacterium]|nr:ISAzo13 family transposase [Bryobacterales bacterium]
MGPGGISPVSNTTGVSRQVIRQVLREFEQSATHPAGVEPATRGHPGSCWRWTSKSVRKLGEELAGMRHEVSYPVVAKNEMGYCLQANRDTKEGESHPDRNAQFEHINARVRQYMHLRQPVISVDTKKKELVGDSKNGGRDWRPKGQPETVRVHDFPIPEQGRAAPYGVYDLAQNAGWVHVGIDHETASFAVATIRRWWHTNRLMITADGGGSNGSHLRTWSKSASGGKRSMANGTTSFYHASEIVISLMMPLWSGRFGLLCRATRGLATRLSHLRLRRPAKR